MLDLTDKVNSERDFSLRILNQIDKFKEKSEKELNEVIKKYNSKNCLYRFFDSYSKDLADREAAKARKNMNYLGIKEFSTKSLVARDMYRLLDELEEQAKQKRIRKNIKVERYF